MPTATMDYKELLKGEKKVVTVELAKTDLAGTFAAIEKKVLARIAKSDEDYNGETITIKAGGTPRYYYEHTPPKATWTRPYSDAEFEVLGKKLLREKLAREQREEKVRKANLKKLNTLQEKLGLPVTEDV
jgi:hypothetical protein